MPKSLIKQASPWVRPSSPGWLARFILTLAPSALASITQAHAPSQSPPPTDGQPPAIVPSEAPRVHPQVAEKLSKREARDDAWDTEVVNETVGEVLSAIGRYLAEPTDDARAALGGVVTADFSCDELRPPDREVIFQDDALTVWRARPSGRILDGPGGFIEAIDDLGAPIRAAEHSHTKLKVVTVTKDGDSAATLIYFAAEGTSERGAYQQNAVWFCHWDVSQDPPRLRRIELRDFTEVKANANRPALYADCTEAVLGANPAFHDQLVPGTEHWLARTDAELDVQRLGHRGLAIGDANGDGLDDLYLCEPGGLPNKLFLQQPDGSAIDASADAHVDYLDATRSALFIDLDNDADQDLVLATRSAIVVLENDGSTHFRVVADYPVTAVHSITAADFDADGDLDIYLCRYISAGDGDTTPVPYHDANNGPPNILLQNDGDWQFTDATSNTGLDANNSRFSFAAAWEDYDNDGDLDLYVANDFGRNNLYRNTGGHFEDVAAEAGVEDISAGMSVAWGDYNRDGLMDLYVSNMFSSAGNRVTYQRNFKEGLDREDLALFQRHARGNSLFENAGDATFRDVSEKMGVTMGRWAWSSRFVDLNNDGLEDILIANGFVTNEDTKDL